MAAVTDKSTYTGQYVSRKRFQKKMDSTNKQRLKSLYIQLGSLLTQRKALNSKVTTRHFELFRESVDSDADPYEIKTRLTRLEQSLKQEGLYKNVKSDFVHIRKDILGSLHWSETAAQHHKHTLPGINTVAKDRTFYIAPKSNADDHAVVSGVPHTIKISSALSTDDMRMLNTAIGKLYRHLQLNQQENAPSEVSSSHKDSTKENVNILTLSSHMNPEESFHEIVLKLRNFEKEFQRQKVQQQREAMRLQEEIKRLNKNTVELRRENERMKGVQPIVTKAKGKQVERIEERHRTEKKGMEDKINELESGLRRNFAQLLHDKEEIRSQIRTDVENVMASINNIHHMVFGHFHESPMAIANRNADDGDLLPTREILDMLTSVAGGVQVMKSKNNDLTSKAEDVGAWRRSLKELDREISRFSRDFADDFDKEETMVNHETDPQVILSTCKSKLQKTRENMSTKLKSIGDATSIIKRKERDVSKYRRNLKELQNEIVKLHDQVVSVQIQDISISTPEFDRRREERSDGSADELPEADRAEQTDLLDKLKQIGTLVNHFQQLIIDRTTILNKMENDILPLKIRVNRLHEEISKAMTSPGSPERDLSDDALKSRRSFSPDGPSNAISREIGNMLTKLSKMELTIRHLLESYATDHGRSSI